MARAKSDSVESGHYKLATSPSHLLHRAQQLATDRFQQLVGDAITLRQLAVLSVIADEPGLNQSQLGRVTGIDRSTLAEVLTRMEANKWIERTASAADARAHAVTLTESGEAVFVACAHHARAADAAILDLLPRTKARTLVTTLAKLAKLAEAAAVKAERQQRKQAKRKAQKRKPKRGARKQSA